MTGIEKILSGIETDGAAAAEKLTTQGKTEAAQIEKQGRAEADAFLKAGKEKADKRAAAQKLNADSAAALKVRNAALLHRSQLIDEVINEAVRQIVSLPDGEYFARLISLAKNNVKEGNGVLKLSAADLGRDTAAFEQELASLNVTLDKTPCDIDNGFILIYGDIEITAQLSALVREKREQLTDTVNRILFAQ